MFYMLRAVLMPYKFQTNNRGKFMKAQHRVANRPACDESLRRLARLEVLPPNRTI